MIGESNGAGDFKCVYKLPNFSVKAVCLRVNIRNTYIRLMGSYETGIRQKCLR